MFSKAKTVDAAIAPLLKAVSDLDEVIQINADRVTLNSNTIIRLQADSAEAETERKRARKISEALSAITNPTEE